MDTLKTRLMQPHLVEEFIRPFHAEVNRLEKEPNVDRGHKAKDLVQINRKLDGLYEAIADGLRTPGLKAKLEELEQRKEELELLISSAPPLAPMLHPNLAWLYRRKVESLHACLDKADGRTEAAGILRGLVESIRVRNLDDGIEIELVGEITNMIEAAQTADLKGKAASEEAASLKNYTSSVKVVAGARKPRESLIVPIDL
jgi:site-specific DNA recombinase